MNYITKKQLFCKLMVNLKNIYGYIKKVFIQFKNIGISQKDNIIRIKYIQQVNLSYLLYFSYFFIIGTIQLVKKNYELAIFDYVMTLLGIINFSYFKIKKNIENESSVFITLLGIGFLFLLIRGGKNGTGLFWSIVFPSIAIYLKGARIGRILGIIYILLEIIILFFMKSLPWVADYSFFYTDVITIYSRMILIQIIMFVFYYFSFMNKHELQKEMNEIHEQKSNFFINLAHETKTPLTLILNYFNKYIRKKGKSIESEIIKSNLKILQRIMVDYLDLEKLNRGLDFYSHQRPVNISDMIHQKILLFKEIAAKKNIIMHQKVEENIYVKIDCFAIDRILNNLLDNAIRYNKIGGSIMVNLITNNEHIELSVIDTGIGMDPEKLNHIFEPFYQISEKHRSIQGLGLGLSIVKTILDQINGVLEIESKKNTGSQFKIKFKRVNYDWKNFIKEKISVSKPIKDISNLSLNESKIKQGYPSILIVEDNNQLITYLYSIMSKKYNVYPATNGMKALELLKAIPVPDVIISDIMMDEMDGHHFYKELRQMNDFKSVPFIFLTAKNSIEEKLKSIQSGAVDFISKPFLIDELLKKIEAHIKLRQAYNENLFKKIERSVKQNRHGLETAIKRRRTTQFSDLHNLTIREKEVLEHLSKNLTHKEIAFQLNKSEQSIRNTSHIIYQKCQVNNRSELIESIENFN